MAKSSSKPSPKRLAAAFKEMAKNPPAAVAATARKEGAKAAHAQLVAIAFAKARKAHKQ